MITYSLARETDLEPIMRLLKVISLPYSDLQQSPIEFIVAKNDGLLIGCIGLERYGSDALFRSFAVEPALQNRGIGKELFMQLLKYAGKNKVKHLHLLTNTARDYFSKIGFRVANRNEAPDPISTSSQFAILCPSSSTYMVLDSIPEYAD